VTTVAAVLAGIPSPSQGVWHLGPFPVRAYALCILLGIGIAVWLGDRRWRARGGAQGTVADVAVWAVPFGVVGGRLYHVVSSPDAYFGPDGDLWRALRIWEGGLGIWGAIALGAVGAWIGCRRSGVRLASFADAVAPGILLAQAVGRFGNYFNQELFGGPTTLPWGLEIDPQNRPARYADVETFHPTFAYEALWNTGAAALLLWADRRFRLGHGRVFWGYVVLYTLGRVWIEALRVDPAEQVLGLRLNIWTSLLVCALGAAAFAVSARLHPGREESLYLPGREPVLSPEPGEPAVGEQAGREQDEQEAHVAPRQRGEDEQPPPHAQGAGEQADDGERR
jgi:prolipoprotein diacylglyceryl transferase